MKTAFEKIGGRWVVPTGKIVTIGYINYGVDYDTILADQYKDVCTGETFGKELDEFTTDMVGEKFWRLVKHYEGEPEYKHRCKNQKKARRAARIYEMVGTHWNDPNCKYTCDEKRLGINAHSKKLHLSLMETILMHMTNLSTHSDSILTAKQKNKKHIQGNLQT